MSDPRDALVAAVKTRRVCRIVRRAVERVVEPWLVGYDRRGDLILQAWPIGDGMKTWLFLPLADISRATLETATFEGRRPYPPAMSRRLVDVVVEVDRARASGSW